MAQLLTSPDRFADTFNVQVPGAHRQITADDVRDLTTCRLIGRYGYYIQLDIETTRAILQYEALRQKRLANMGQESNDGLSCKLCGKPLAIEPDGKRGRPREYCADCEPFRGRERYRRWRGRQAPARSCRRPKVLSIPASNQAETQAPTQ